MIEELCDDQNIQTVLAEVNAGPDRALHRIDRLLEIYPRDARLHFLKGSVLVGMSKPIEAHASLMQAVEIAPEFAIARFQLGFFQLTSGEAENALTTWQPLDALPQDHYLKLFVQGLRHLIKDEFDAAFAYLERGLAANNENPPLNNDIQLLIDQIRALDEAPPSDKEKLAENTGEGSQGNESVSATSLILGGLLGKKKKH